MEGHKTTTTTTNNIIPMAPKATPEPNSHHKKNDTVDGSSHSHILQDVSEASPLTDRNHDQRDLESATKLDTNNKQQQQQHLQQHQSSGELFMSTYFVVEVFILHKIQINNPQISRFLKIV